MNNEKIIKEYIKGEKDCNAYCHLMYKGNELVNYSTVLVIIDRENKQAKLNIKKYSSTTSRIQTKIRWLLTKEGYSIEEYEGENARWWNCGYMGAPTITKKEAKEW